MLKTVIIRLYQPAEHEIWNSFLLQSNTPLFLFHRQFMTYHQHRFADHSLLFYTHKNELIALLPANLVQNNQEKYLYTHQGLTFGGFITKTTCSFVTQQQLWQNLQQYCHEQGICKIVYKTVPSFLQVCPSATDEFLLQTQPKITCQIDLNSILPLQANQSWVALQNKWQQRKFRNLRKAIDAKLEIQLTNTVYEQFWELLTSNLASRFGVQPTHSWVEVANLATIFPSKIFLFTVWRSATLVAGTVLFDYGQTLHAQYIAANAEGKSCGAIDFLFAYLLEKYWQNYSYFSFGISNTRHPLTMNTGLLEWKQGWGTHLVAHRTFVALI